MATSVRSIACTPETLYLTRDGFDRAGGLWIVDIADPSKPTRVSSYGSGPGSGLPWQVAVQDGYAYVAAGQSGVRVLDVSDPTYPTEIGASDQPADAEAIAVADSNLYVGDASGGLWILRAASARPVASSN
jgi:hypothetical protein